MGTYTIIRIFLPQGAVTVSSFLPETIYVYSNVCMHVFTCLLMSVFSPGSVFFTQRYLILCYSSSHYMKVACFKYFNCSPIDGSVLLFSFYKYCRSKYLVHLSLHICVNMSVEYIPRNGILGAKDVCIVNLQILPNFSPQGTSYFIPHFPIINIWEEDVSCLPRAVLSHSVVRLFDVCPHKQWKMYITIVTFLSFTRF